MQLSWLGMFKKTTRGANTEVQLRRLLTATLASHATMLVCVWLPCCSPSFWIIHLGMQNRMTHVLELPSTGDTQMQFLAPDFYLAQGRLL